MFLPIIFFCLMSTSQGSTETSSPTCGFHVMPATESLQFCNQNLKERYDMFVEQKDKFSRVYAACVPVKKSNEVVL